MAEMKLIPRDYHDAAEKAYGQYVRNNKFLNLITVRNYIAGMTDVFATNQHARLFMPLERVPI